MAGIRTLAVPAFKNQTLEPRVESLLATTLIKQLQQDGTYKIASERDADAVVEGTLKRLERIPARGVRTDFYQTSEYLLDMIVGVKVIEKSTGKTISEKEVRGGSSFFVSGLSTLTADVNRDERQAIPQAAEDAAVRITSYLSEGW
jgi:hypothetical protein